jgi:hypothetical protein
MPLPVSQAKTGSWTAVAPGCLVAPGAPGYWRTRVLGR